MIRDVGRSRIIHFDEALMLVRATKIVASAKLAGELSPEPFPIQELSCSFRLPDIQELQGVFNIQHLVKCSQWQYFHCPNFCAGTPTNKAEWITWKDRFSRVMYRMMLAGAVLARAFHELFKRAEKEGRTEFRDKFSDLQCGKELASKPTEEDIEYLRQFPVYNFDPDDDTDVGKWKDQEYEKTFGPFADWLIKAGRVRGVQDKMTYSDCDLEECLLLSDAEIEFDEPTQGVLWELVLSMGACEHSDINQATTSANSQYDSDSRPELMGKSREVMVVMFGTFQVEVITMPLNIDSQTNHYLTAHPLVSGRLRETELFSKAHSDAYTSPISIDICSTIEHLASKSRRAHGDLSDGHEPPHPLFHLFVSIAKKYCNSSFFPGTFDEAKESDYLSQIVWGGIFKTTEWYLPFERYRPASATADEQMGSTDVYFLSGIPHVLRLLKEFYSLPNSSCQIPG